MKKIRKGIFETNSSSSHSIHIDHDTQLMDISLIPDSNGIITIECDYYGWDWDTLRGAHEKANYCLTDVRNNTEKKELLREVIMEQTGAKEVKFITDGDYVGIDHQSSGNTHEAFKSKELLRNLIFNERSTIHTGNDNSEAPLHFYCDSSIGKYKVTLIDETKYRDMNISSILDEESNSIEDKNYNWVYTFDKKGTSIEMAVSEYIEYYLIMEESRYPHYDIDNNIVNVYYTSYSPPGGITKVSIGKYAILIKENKK